VILANAENLHYLGNPITDEMYEVIQGLAAQNAKLVAARDKSVKPLDLLLTPEIFEIAKNAYRCKIVDRNYSHLEALEVCLISVFNELNKRSIKELSINN
jgi:hypothetical protein